MYFRLSEKNSTREINCQKQGNRRLNLFPAFTKTDYSWFPKIRFPKINVPGFKHNRTGWVVPLILGLAGFFISQFHLNIMLTLLIYLYACIISALLTDYLLTFPFHDFLTFRKPTIISLNVKVCYLSKNFSVYFPSLSSFSGLKNSNCW